MTRRAGLLIVSIAAVLAAAPLAASTAAFQPSIPDVPVVTQDGKSVHFYSDLVKGNSVAVNFIFTNCKTICPMLGGMFTNLQKQDNGQMKMISVSIDPTVDTPRRLKEWGAKFHPGPNWTFVTGRQDDIDQILKAFGTYTSLPQEHLPITIIGSDVSGVWTRNYGFLSGAEMTAVIARIHGATAKEAAGK
jgi:protein SCO1/2